MNAPHIETSAEIGALAKALPKAQAAIAKITKDAANPHFNSKYASLTEIAGAVLPAMNANGFTILQPASSDDAGVSVVTVLLHESGEWMRSTHLVPVSRRDAQGIGSALTYARRQALQSFLTVAPEGEDDDAEGAVGRGNAPKPPLNTPKPAQEPPSLTVRANRLAATLNGVKTLHDLTRAWDLAKELRADLAKDAPADLAALDELHTKRHAVLIGGAG
jgi:hypothetical protein